MTNTKRIVFLYREAMVPEPIVEQMLARTPGGFDLTLCEATTPDARRRELVAAADYVIAYAVPFEDLEVARNVRLLQLLSAGYDRIDVRSLARAGIPVADNGGANAPTVAEHTVLLMLSVLKKLPLHHAALQRGEWLGLSEGLSMRELGGKQVGIVGFGRIGQAVARNVRGFLARVVYHDDRAAPAHIEAELEAKRVSFDALVETSDVVTVHTPLTDATRGLFDRRVFDRMKRTAILVNTARGPVVNQAHLVEALDRASIAGAGLDVFESEPLGADNPLLGRDNVVVTPHNAGTTIDTWTRRLDFAFSNIERVARGEAPHSVVNDG